MAEIRDAGEVYAEQVAAFAAAVESAKSTAAGQAQQAQQVLAGSGLEGDVFRPGPADAPSL